MHKNDFDRGYDDSFTTQPLTQEQCEKMGIYYSSYIEGFNAGYNDSEYEDEDGYDDIMDVTQYY